MLGILQGATGKGCVGTCADKESIRVKEKESTMAYL